MESKEFFEKIMQDYKTRNCLVISGDVGLVVYS